MSYRPMVSTGGEFAGNALRFATREEAEASALDLACRWVMVERWKAEESDDPVNCVWDATNGNVHISEEVTACGAADAM